MTILLLALATAFAAFCVWLTMRIVNRRERWAISTAVALAVLLVGYPLSFGPACWIFSRQDPHNRLLIGIYNPLVQMYAAFPPAIQQPLRRFIGFGLPPDTEFIAFDPWFFYFDERGYEPMVAMPILRASDAVPSP